MAFPLYKVPKNGAIWDTGDNADASNRSNPEARNLYCPYSEHLHTCFPMWKESGSFEAQNEFVPNIGTHRYLWNGDTTNVAESSEDAGDGVDWDGVAFGPLSTIRDSDSEVGRFYNFAAGATATQYISFWRNRTANTYSMPAGTILIYIKWGTDLANSNNTPLIHNSLDASSDQGAFRLFLTKSGANVGRINLNITDSGGTNRNTQFSGAFGTSAAWTPIIVSWGPRYGHRIITRAGSSTNSSYTTIPYHEANNGSWFLCAAAGASGGTSVGSNEVMDIAHFSCWDRELDPWMTDLLLADPLLPSRHTPAKDVSDTINHGANPLITCQQQTSVTFGMGLRANAGVLNCGIRVYVKTAAASSWPASAQKSTFTSDAYGRATLVATTAWNGSSNVSLTAGTDYEARCEFTLDGGSSWEPYPGGPMSFKTARADSDETFEFGVLGDCHVGGTSSEFPNSATTEFGASAQRRRELAVSLLSQAVRMYEDWDFAVHVGDGPMTDSNHTEDGTITQLTAGNGGFDDSQFNAYRNFFHHWHNVLSTNNFEMVLGNHESECGYLQWCNKDAEVPLQAISTIARKRSIALPDNNTYSQGGENEGDPSVTTTLDWLPQVSESSGGNSAQVFDSTYLDTYVRDVNGINASPLENYWARETGNALFIYLDVNRYADPGDASESGFNTPAPSLTGGSHDRPDKPWQLGATQLTWLTTVLKNSTANWKFVFLHNLPGGERISAVGISKSDNANYGDETSGAGRNYGRGSGVNTITSAEEEFLELCAEYGVTAVIKGHDHKACHVVRSDLGDLNILTVPNGGAPNLTEGDGNAGGWNWETIADSYGTSETGHLGVGNILDWDGAAMTTDLKYAENVIGYLAIGLTSSTCTIRFVQVDFSRNARSATDVSNFWKGLERNKYDSYSLGGNTTSTETEITQDSRYFPWLQRAFLYNDSQLSGNYWESLDTGASGGEGIADIMTDDYPEHRNRPITTGKTDDLTSPALYVYHSTSVSDKRALVLPRVSYETTITNADYTPPAVGTDAIDGDVRTISRDRDGAIRGDDITPTPGGGV